jgi:hypothetical protein
VLFLVRAFDGEITPKFAASEFTIDHGEFNIEAHGLTVFGALEPSAFARAAWPDVHLNRRDRVLGNQRAFVFLPFGFIQV